MSTVQSVVKNQIDHVETWGKRGLNQRPLTEQELRETGCFNDMASAREEYLEIVKRGGSAAERKTAHETYRMREEAFLLEARQAVNQMSREVAVVQDPPVHTERIPFTADSITATSQNLSRIVPADKPPLPVVSIDAFPLSEHDLQSLYASLTNGGRVPLTWESFKPLYQSQDPCGVPPSEEALATLLRRHRLKASDTIDFNTFCILELDLHQRL